MVAVGSYYNISEQEIEAVTKEDSGDSQYPYRLKVQTKTGHNYIVNYQMGLADVFTAEDRVSVKFSDFYSMMQAAATAEAEAKLMRNAINCDLPHAHIRCMLTGENDLLEAYKATGLTPDGLREMDKAYAEKCGEVAVLRAENETLIKELDEARTPVPPPEEE